MFIKHTWCCTFTYENDFPACFLLFDIYVKFVFKCERDRYFSDTVMLKTFRFYKVNVIKSLKQIDLFTRKILCFYISTKTVFSVIHLDLDWLRRPWSTYVFFVKISKPDIEQAIDLRVFSHFLSHHQ